METNIGKRISWLSIVSLCASMFFFSAPLGVVLGLVAKNEIKNNPNSLTGTRIANWGIGLGIFSVLYMGLCVVYYNTVTIVNWRRSEDNSRAVAESIIRAGGGYRELREGNVSAPRPKPEFSFFPFLQ